MAAAVIVVLGILAAGLPPGAVYRPPESGARLHLDADHLATVEGSINGRGPFTLMLDTGSNRSAVSGRLARSLGLPSVATTSVVTAASSDVRLVVRLDQIAIGGAAKTDLLVPVLDSADLGVVGPGVDGILGQDFLLDQNYTLDYEHRRLSWDRAPTSPTAGRLALVEHDGRWLVALPQPADPAGAVIRLVPDSGATALVMFDRGAPLPLSTKPLATHAPLSIIGGAASARAVLIGLMSIGSIVLCDHPALVVSRRDPGAPAGDGLLPLSMFASVTFDATNRELAVRPR